MTEQSRKRILCILIAVLVSLAGCGSSTTGANTPELTERQTPTVTPTLSQTPKPATESTKNATLDELIKQQGADEVGLNDSNKERVHSVLANFSENLPENKSERKTVLLQTADKVCQKRRQNFSETIDLKRVETEGKEAKQFARRLSYSSQIINERFTDNVPASKFSDVRSGVDKTTKYAPVLGSVERFMNASCIASEKRTDESLRRFQIAAMMVGVDLVLAYSGVGYNPAFKGTRYVMNTGSKVGLYRLRYVCGNRCWALAWSETHWILRGEMVKAIHDTFLLTVNTGLSLSAKDMSYLAQKHNLNKTQVLKLNRTLRDEGIELGVKLFNHIEGCLPAVDISNTSDNPVKAVKNAKKKANKAVSGLFGETNKSGQSTTPCED